MSAPGLVYVTSHPMTVRLLLRGQLEWMARHGYDVTAITSTGGGTAWDREHPGFGLSRVPMRREISPARDALTLLRLVLLLRRLRPEIVNASTPKAGFLGSLAARMTGVPVRIYVLRGLRLETTRGVRRRILRTTERLACAAAHRVICVSPSLQRRCEELGLCKRESTAVLGDGSSNGVDLARFARRSDQCIAGLRRELGLGDETPVVGFVGRLTRDKGIDSLRRAFEVVHERLPSARLLLIGGEEPGDPLPAGARRWLADSDFVHDLGAVSDTAPYYSLMQVLALPSLREGLPNAPLEAAAAGIPTVGFAVTGTVDAVEDEAGGLLVPPLDHRQFGQALLRYLEDQPLAEAHGRYACRRVARMFQPERVWQELDGEYRRLLRAADRPLPEVS